MVFDIVMKWEEIVQIILNSIGISSIQDNLL
jgi:hypothetical protein